MPPLDEVLGAFPDVPVLIEVKELAACEAVRATLDRHGAVARAGLPKTFRAAAAAEARRVAAAEAVPA